MKVVKDFICDVMVVNPGCKIYWDGSKFMMDVQRGYRLKFNFSKKIYHDEAADAIYYTDENNCRIYLLYLNCVD